MPHVAGKHREKGIYLFSIVNPFFETMHCKCVPEIMNSGAVVVFNDY
jgi:hypothetical protein